ncbi:hypothetical protein, partial [Romboutsia sp.]|uniref:hypothetical protein n=1 Tax=Romboutsia sp. TaxID=1965302 RepID=UPI003F2B30FB
MEQVITVQVKLNPTKEQIKLIDNGSLDYIKIINELVSEMVTDKKSTKRTSANIVVGLNSAVKNQAIKDGKSVFKKAKKSKYKIIPILKKPAIVWNNQINAIRKMDNKEQRYMNNQDHKISREIVNFAKNNNVSVIRLECLEGI